MFDFAASLGLQSLLLFATTVLVVNATPGADMLLTFTNTMKHGVRGGLATALGVSAGSIVHTLLVVLGVAALMAASPTAYRLLQWGGAAYLVWIAIGLVREGLRVPVAQDASDQEIAAIVDVPAWRTGGEPSSAAPHALASPTHASTPFVQGLTTNVLNPKVALFFLALLPQFVAPTSSHKPLAFAVLGAWFAVQGFVFMALFVRAVAVLRRWQPTPARRRALHMVAAAALLLVALRLVLLGSLSGGTMGAA